MPCPTCEHTMQSVGESVAWCPRCGTIQGNWEAGQPPKLVQRCRDFAARAFDSDLLTGVDSVLALAEWQSCGVDESINPVVDRRGLVTTETP
jgi:hypothetical protein